MNMVQIFGVVNEESNSNDSRRSKKSFPIIHVNNRIYFDISSVYFNFDQYLSAIFS